MKKYRQQSLTLWEVPVVGYRRIYCLIRVKFIPKPLAPSQSPVAAWRTQVLQFMKANGFPDLKEPEVSK
jgi:hypothetical protein